MLKGSGSLGVTHTLSLPPCSPSEQLWLRCFCWWCSTCQMLIRQQPDLHEQVLPKIQEESYKQEEGFVGCAVTRWLLSVWIIVRVPAFHLNLQMCFNRDTHTCTCTQVASSVVLQHTSTSRGASCPPVACDFWSQPSSFNHHFSRLPNIQLFSFLICMWNYPALHLPVLKERRTFALGGFPKSLSNFESGKILAFFNLNAFSVMKLGSVYDIFKM